MAVRVELVDGKKADSRAFETAYSKVCDHIYFKCLDDQGMSSRNTGLMKMEPSCNCATSR